MSNFCECGYGQLCNKRFILGHNIRIYPVLPNGNTDKTKRKTYDYTFRIK